MPSQRTNPDPSRLGTVEDVDGATVRVKVSETTPTGLLFIRGDSFKVGQVGSFVRIPSGYIDLFGIVSQVGAGAAPPSPDTDYTLGDRWMRVELVGEGTASSGFNRGVSQLPTIGDWVHVTAEDDLRAIYAPGTSNEFVSVGRSSSAESLPAYININRLVSRHAAVVGSTGSGKSSAVASILNRVSEHARFPGARVVLFDLHGEYAGSFGARGRVFSVNPDVSKQQMRLVIPFWALTSEELIAVAFGKNLPASSSSVLDHIRESKCESKPCKKKHDIDDSSITADTPLPFCLHQLWLDMYIERFATHTASSTQNQSNDTIAWDTDFKGEHKGNALSVTRPRFRSQNQKKDQDKIFVSAFNNMPSQHIDALEKRLKDPRLQFIFRPGKWEVNEASETDADLDDLLEDWMPSSGGVTVFDLSGIPSAVIDILVGAVLRIIYDAMFWGRNDSAGGRSRPVLLVLEEAHSYLGQADASRAIGGGPACASAVARQIAKEGRKYGVGLMLVTQRPSEIDQTILAQCGTLIALRLTNDRDRSHISAAASDNLAGLFAMLPILRTHEALIVGEAVNLPVRARLDLPSPSQWPNSRDPEVVPSEDANDRAGWIVSSEGNGYRDLVRMWRLQDCSNKEKSE